MFCQWPIKAVSCFRIHQFRLYSIIILQVVKNMHEQPSLLSWLKDQEPQGLDQPWSHLLRLPLSSQPPSLLTWMCSPAILQGLPLSWAQRSARTYSLSVMPSLKDITREISKAATYIEIQSKLTWFFLQSILLFMGTVGEVQVQVCILEPQWNPNMLAMWSCFRQKLALSKKPVSDEAAEWAYTQKMPVSDGWAYV